MILGRKGDTMTSILLDRFRNYDFTKSQRKIAQYMVENEYELPHMSLMDVSRAVGVSDASVLRLVRMIGFEGYNDFKRELYGQLVEQAGVPAGNDHKLTDRLPSKNEKNYPSVSVAQDTAVQIVTGSLQLNPLSVYDEIITSVRKSRRVYIYGRRGTRDVARHFATCLRYIVDSVVFLDYYEEVYPALAGADENDLFLFFCLSRFYDADIHICQAARARKIPLCLITDQAPSVISGFASTLLRVKTASLSYFNSSLGTMAICEYLLARIGNDTQTGSLLARLDYIDEYTDSERCH